MAIYICWNEETAEFSHWEYVGGGVTVARSNPVIVTKRCRWSSENTPEMRARAEAYIAQYRTEAWVEVGE